MQARRDPEFFEALFDHANVGIIISNEHGEMVAVNQFAADMFMYEVEELIGQKIEMLLPKRVRGAHVKHREDYAKDPAPRTMGTGLDLQALRKNGEEFFVEVSLSFYKIQNKNKVVSFINDVSENRRIKEELRSQADILEKKAAERTKELSEALVELNQTNKDLENEVHLRQESESRVKKSLEKEKELGDLKSKFVSMASHEFRTPLAGILSSAALIGKYNKEEQIDKRQKHILRIKKSVENLTSILNDFLSLDKLEQGVISAKASDFEFVEFINELLDQVKSTYTEEPREISFHCSSKTLELHQDSDILRNILINLLSNAVKYSEPSSAVLLKAEVEQKNLVIHVIDHGRGIPEEDQKHLFQRFYRASNSFGVQGTGLGLNIVQKYLSYIGGDITFKSKENEGTTFIVALPMELKK